MVEFQGKEFSVIYKTYRIQVVKVREIHINALELQEETFYVIIGILFSFTEKFCHSQHMPDIHTYEC